MKKIINWKTFFILLTLGLVSVICVIPYILSVQGELLRNIDVPLEILFVAQFVQCLILFSVTIFFGLIFTKKVGLSLPLIEVTKGEYKKVLKDILGRSVLFGVVVAVAIYALDIIFTAFGVNISTHQNLAPAWQKILAAIYGGTTEEILMRLFLMTLFVWIGMKIFKQKKPSKAGVIIPIFLAAIIFGLGHLPITASLTQIDTLVVTRAIVLNGIGGMTFGWLFWKKGLESAMIAHFTADIFLLTILPLLF